MASDKIVIGDPKNTEKSFVNTNFLDKTRTENLNERLLPEGYDIVDFLVNKFQEVDKEAADLIKVLENNKDKKGLERSIDEARKEVETIDSLKEKVDAHKNNIVYYKDLWKLHLKSVKQFIVLPDSKDSGGTRLSDQSLEGRINNLELCEARLKDLSSALNEYYWCPGNELEAHWQEVQRFMRIIVNHYDWLLESPRAMRNHGVESVIKDIRDKYKEQATIKENLNRELLPPEYDEVDSLVDQFTKLEEGADKFVAMLSSLKKAIEDGSITGHERNIESESKKLDASSTPNWCAPLEPSGLVPTTEVTKQVKEHLQNHLQELLAFKKNMEIHQETTLEPFIARSDSTDSRGIPLSEYSLNQYIENIGHMEAGFKNLSNELDNYCKSGSSWEMVQFSMIFFSDPSGYEEGSEYKHYLSGSFMKILREMRDKYKEKATTFKTEDK